MRVMHLWIFPILILRPRIRSPSIWGRAGPSASRRLRHSQLFYTSRLIREEIPMDKRHIILSAMFLASAAFAQPGAIVLTTEAFKEVEVVNAKGEKEFKLVPPGTAVPRDEIVYVTTFENR